MNILHLKHTFCQGFRHILHIQKTRIANFKFFLTASPEARAERVTKMYQSKGQNINYEEVYKGLVDRDYQDSHREISPLRQAPDAILIDASNISQEEVVQKILSIINGDK